MLREIVKFDGDKIENIVKRYSGNDGAHFSCIIDNEEHRALCAGGRGDLLGLGLAEIMAHIAHNTLPKAQRGGFFTSVIEVARDMLKEMEDSEDVAERG